MPPEVLTEILTTDAISKILLAILMWFVLLMMFKSGN
jgi:hypothetical protein